MATARPKFSDWMEIREEVLERDSYRCQECGAFEDLHVHHMEPLSEGGDNSMGNLVTLCEGCHQEEHGATPRQVLGWMEPGVPYLIGELADALDVHKSTARGYLQALIEEGTINRRKPHNHTSIYWQPVNKKEADDA